MFNKSYCKPGTKFDYHKNQGTTKLHDNLVILEN